MKEEFIKALGKAIKTLPTKYKFPAYDIFFNYFFSEDEPDFSNEIYSENKQLWYALYNCLKEMDEALSKEE